MAGSYGWNFGNTQDFIQNEGGYDNTLTTAGTGGTELEYENPNPFLKGFCCCCCVDNDQPSFNEPNGGQPPQKIIVDERGYYWCVSSGEIPAEAVKVGLDKDGGDIYVGRAIHEGELQPAKIVPNHGCAYIAFDGEEVRKDEYEILCRGQCSVIWQECQDGMVPSNAVAVGCTSDNEKLYIGRVFHDGTHTPGKIQPSHGVCYIPYGGEEHSYSNYEVLILQ